MQMPASTLEKIEAWMEKTGAELESMKKLVETEKMESKKKEEANDKAFRQFLLLSPIDLLQKAHELSKEENALDALVETMGDTTPLSSSDEESDCDAATTRDWSGTPVVDMAQSVPPGDIVLQPGTKIVFNAPFGIKQNYHIMVSNCSARRIGYLCRTSNPKRLGVDPGSGVLSPEKNSLITVYCGTLVYGQEDTCNDRVTIEWTNIPDGARHFRRKWFTGEGMVRRKCLPIEYNP